MYLFPLLLILELGYYVVSSEYIIIMKKNYNLQQNEELVECTSMFWV